MSADAVSNLTSDGLTSEVVAIYQQTEDYLLADIAKRVAAGGEVPNWELQKLAQTQSLLYDATGVLNSAASQSVPAIHQSLQLSFNIGAHHATSSVEDQLGLDLPPVEWTQHDPKLLALINETTQAVAGDQHQAILRSVNDTYRKVVRQTAAQLAQGTMTLDQAVQMSINGLANDGLTGFTDKAGRNWSLDSYSEMALRTANGRATLMGHETQLKKLGHHLVLVSYANRPCPLCAAYEGRVLSIDGEEMDQAIATVDTARANGLFHCNCKHVVTAYFPGITHTPPHPKYDPDDYEAEQRQRAIERTIRKWKRRAMVATTPEAQAEAAAKVKQWQKAAAANNAQRQYKREQLKKPTGKFLPPVEPAKAPVKPKLVKPPPVKPWTYSQYMKEYNKFIDPSNPLAATKDQWKAWLDYFDKAVAEGKINAQVTGIAPTAAKTYMSSLMDKAPLVAPHPVVSGPGAPAPVKPKPPLTEAQKAKKLADLNKKLAAAEQKLKDAQATGHKETGMYKYVVDEYHKKIAALQGEMKPKHFTYTKTLNFSDLSKMTSEQLKLYKAELAEQGKLSAGTSNAVDSLLKSPAVKANDLAASKAKTITGKLVGKPMTEAEIKSANSSPLEYYHGYDVTKMWKYTDPIPYPTLLKYSAQDLAQYLHDMDYQGLLSSYEKSAVENLLKNKGGAIPAPTVKPKLKPGEINYLGHVVDDKHLKYTVKLGPEVTGKMTPDELAQYIHDAELQQLHYPATIEKLKAILKDKEAGTYSPSKSYDNVAAVAAEPPLYMQNLVKGYKDKLLGMKTPDEVKGYINQLNNLQKQYPTWQPGVIDVVKQAANKSMLTKTTMTPEEVKVITGANIKSMSGNELKAWLKDANKLYNDYGVPWEQKSGLDKLMEEAKQLADRADCPSGYRIYTNAEQKRIFDDFAHEFGPTKGYKALNWYKGMGFSTMNSALRNDLVGASKSTIESIKDLDQLYAEHALELPQNTWLTRNMERNPFWDDTKLKPGDTVLDKGYMSTTVQPGGVGFGGTTLRIRAPKGTKYVPGTDYEHEFLLNRGTVLRVLSVDTETHTFDVEIVT